MSLLQDLQQRVKTDESRVHSAFSMLKFYQRLLARNMTFDQKNVFHGLYVDDIRKHHHTLLQIYAALPNEITRLVTLYIE